MSISEFLAKNPSIPEILNYIEMEAQRIAAERKASGMKKSEFQ